MNKTIFVNATSATEGGILTILNQFLKEIESLNNKEIKYYVFTSIDLVTNSRNINIISDINGKKLLDRIVWDLFGMRKWAKKNNIYPDLIISLQNTGVIFNKVPQLVYLHQALPFALESKWSMLKQDEYKLWVYKNIYKRWIYLTVGKRSNIIVQTKYMKDLLVNNGYNEKNIIILHPNVSDINIKDIKEKKYKCKYLFYPSAEYKYKNHKIIISAVQLLAKRLTIKDDFKIIFTLDKTSNTYRNVNKYNLDKYFEFIGKVEYSQVLEYYKGCHGIIFPSYIESFGLPLEEGKIFGKKVLASNCEFSRELLENYSLASFASYNNSEIWANEIQELLNDYEEKPINIKQIYGWNDIVQKIINKKNM